MREFVRRRKSEMPDEIG